MVSTAAAIVRLNLVGETDIITHVIGYNYERYGALREHGTEGPQPIREVSRKVAMTRTKAHCQEPGGDRSTFQQTEALILGGAWLTHEMERRPS